MLDLCLGPVGERLADESVSQRDQPLTREPWEVFTIRKVISHNRVLLCLFQYLGYAKALVLRHGEVLYRVAVDVLLGALDE